MADPVVEVLNEPQGVRTIRLNQPKRCNALGPKLRAALLNELAKAAGDNSVDAVVLTGAGDYYSSGVDFASSLKPMYPHTLVSFAKRSNQQLFETFLDFPKPIVVAVNGPAYGAAVTSLLLCDAVYASDTATFQTPFAALGLVPEGCSSVTFPKRLGEDAARKLLRENWQPNAKEAAEVGLVDHAPLPAAELLGFAQKAAAKLVSEKTPKRIQEHGVANLKKVNKSESVALASAFVSPAFLSAQEGFMKRKNKKAMERVFFWARVLRPLWYPLAVIPPKVATAVIAIAALALHMLRKDQASRL